MLAVISYCPSDKELCSFPQFDCKCEAIFQLHSIHEFNFLKIGYIKTQLYVHLRRILSFGILMLTY